MWQDARELLFDFEGRVNRLQYFLVPVILAIIVIVSFSGFSASMSFLNFSGFFSALGILIFALPTLLVLVWVPLAMTVKRLHDINLSGYFVLVIIGIQIFQNTRYTETLDRWTLNYSFHYSFYTLPQSIASFIAQLTWLFLICWPGTKGGNIYGQPPFEK